MPIAPRSVTKLGRRHRVKPPEVRGSGSEHPRQAVNRSKRRFMNAALRTSHQKPPRSVDGPRIPTTRSRPRADHPSGVGTTDLTSRRHSSPQNASTPHPRRSQALCNTHNLRRIRMESTTATTMTPIWGHVFPNTSTGSPTSRAQHGPSRGDPIDLDEEPESGRGPASGPPGPIPQAPLRTMPDHAHRQTRRLVGCTAASRLVAWSAGWSVDAAGQPAGWSVDRLTHRSTDRFGPGDRTEPEPAGYSHSIVPGGFEVMS